MNLLMVKMQPGTAPRLDLPVTAGYILHMDGIYINSETGEKVAETQLHLTGPQELHFMASSKRQFQGYYYIQEYDRQGRAYHCSCYEARTTGFCQHIEQLDPHFVVA